MTVKRPTSRSGCFIPGERVPLYPLDKMTSHLQRGKEKSLHRLIENRSRPVCSQSLHCVTQAYGRKHRANTDKIKCKAIMRQFKTRRSEHSAQTVKPCILKRACINPKTIQNTVLWFEYSGLMENSHILKTAYFNPKTIQNTVLWFEYSGLMENSRILKIA
jgi:hypothetical protein